jgi:hypothetical protein
MKKYLSHICFIGSFVLTVSANASGVPFHVSTYDFPLAGGGGGSLATLNGVPVQIFCDDFSNEIWVPSDNSANVTQVTSSDLSATRFGAVTSWTSISVGDATDQTFLNTGAGSAAGVRYDLVAYLVSLYSLPAGNNTANNTIQEAIWTLMDPSVYPSPKPLNPDSVDPSSYLEQAASWYIGGGATTAFLSQFEIVSDALMTPGTLSSGWVGVGGFQEQIVMTPEPRGGVWMLIGFFGMAAFLVQRARTRRAFPELG